MNSFSKNKPVLKEQQKSSINTMVTCKFAKIITDGLGQYYSVPGASEFWEYLSTPRH